MMEVEMEVTAAATPDLVTIRSRAAAPSRYLRSKWRQGGWRCYE